MKKPSLADIARSLNVSKTTVSLVLNNKGTENGINEDTQKRILAKAKELNYKPNQVARLLRTGKSHTLGLIVADISNHFYARICRSVEDQARKFGYRLMICSSDEDHEIEQELIQMLRERQVDGLIIASTLENPKTMEALKEEGFPCVLIDRHYPGIDSDHVVVDNHQGSVEAVDHLVKLGYQRIAQMTISPSHLSTIRDRHLGYKEALEKHGLPFDDSLVWEIPYNDIRNSVKKALKELVSPPNSADALFVVNNNIAKAALECLMEMNLSIPKDLAIISFDDLEMFRFCNPPLTAVAQPIEAIGQEAVDALMESMKRKQGTPFSPIQKVLKTQLVIRQSCGTNLKVK